MYCIGNLITLNHLKLFENYSFIASLGHAISFLMAIFLQRNLVHLSQYGGIRISSGIRKSEKK